MKILILGAGVIGTTYAWQMSRAGHAITFLVRKGKRDQLLKNGVTIRCMDQRSDSKKQFETVYRPASVEEELNPTDDYDLIIVSVKSNQLDSVLPILAEKAGKTNVLFFLNNWWGDEKIKQYLSPTQYLFGFSRVVGGWRTNDIVECMIFKAPGMATMLGEKDGQVSPRLKEIEQVMSESGMQPEISHDVLGWLAAHYVEYLGPVGAILKAGSAAAFAGNSALVKEAILATREGLDVCRARGIDVGKSAPQNLKLFGLPLFLLVPIGRMQYGMSSIRQFFEESIAHNMDEITSQYYDVLNEGKRLGVNMPTLEELEKCYRMPHGTTMG